MKRPAHSRTPATRLRLLDAAETLFARHGFHSPSIRDITTLANANLAAVHYHFRDKQGLIAAVLERRIRPVNESRLRLLDDYLRTLPPTEPPSLERIVRIYVEPALLLRRSAPRRGADIVRLIGRIHSGLDANLRPILDSLFRAVARRFLPLLEQLTPQLDPPERINRLRFSFGAVSFALQSLDGGWLPGNLPPPPNDDALIDHLCRYLAAALSAPPSSAPLLLPAPAPPRPRRKLSPSRSSCQSHPHQGARP